MRASIGRQLDMARRVREFGRSHPDDGASYTAARMRLEQLIVEAEEYAGRQDAGFVDVRNASARRRELRERMEALHLKHLATIGRRAAIEDPGLARRLAFTAESRSTETFRTVARRIAAAAAEQRELLARYGLDERVLDELERSLDQFDGTIVLGHEGRQKHVAATAALTRVAAAIMDTVEVLDGLNRFRFAADPVALAAWKSARNLVTITPASEEVSPAA